jgi:MFS family permease
MAGRVRRRASRALTWMAVIFGTALGALPPLAFPLLDLAYYLPADPPAILPVMIWPLVPVRFAVGLLFGPLAGFVTGVATQVLVLGLGGFDLTVTWNWVIAGALGGWIVGWLPGHLPTAWRPSGRRRLAGAGISGLVASLIGYVPIVLDPLLRPDVSPAFALAEYGTIAVPNSILVALTLPLVLAAGLWLRLHPAIHISEPAPAARPSWRPFAMAFALAVAVPLIPLYLPSNIQVIGQASAAAVPAAAPAPDTSGSSDRVVSLSLGDPPAIDPSCDVEGDVHSPPVWVAVQVRLYNETGTSVGVSWLDYSGHRDENHAILADGPLEGVWGAGHLFVLTGPDGGCLMIMKVLGTTPVAIHLRS